MMQTRIRTIFIRSLSGVEGCDADAADGFVFAQPPGVDETLSRN
jgi:hypothetical protein